MNKEQLVKPIRPVPPKEPTPPKMKDGKRNWKHILGGCAYVVFCIALLIGSLHCSKSVTELISVALLALSSPLVLVIACSKSRIPVSEEEAKAYEKAMSEYPSLCKKYDEDTKAYVKAFREYAKQLPLTLKLGSGSRYSFEHDDEKASSPFFTFFRVGPDMLTYQYPVDTTPYKEIYEENGLIGPANYLKFEGALQALKDNDNDWFCEDENEEVNKLLSHDLLILARRHGMPGAYSLLGSITSNYDSREKYWEAGATLGNRECMVCRAMALYCSGRTVDGFMLLKRGADKGDKMGCFLTAISYQYGTLSEIDLNKAGEYYLKSLDGEMDFYACLNIGCLLVESGYYHTAIRWFEKMHEIAKTNESEWKEYGNFENYFSNLETCKSLLEYPYIERAKRVNLQAHSRRLTQIFCKDSKSIPTFVPEHLTINVQKWEPKPEQIEIDPADIRERSIQATLPEKRVVDNAEDFQFITIPIRIDNPEIQGTQQELIFLEKCCHAELNAYIKQNLSAIRNTARSMGYVFTYWPAHLTDFLDSNDRLGSYYNDYGEYLWKKGLSFKDPDEAALEYWHSIIPGKKLPEDCAGFLKYVPNLDNLDDHTHYEYILFPFRPGTDWPRAFREFFNLIRTKPIVKIHQQEEPVPLLPSGSILDISLDYNISLRDNCDQVLAEIKMPTLSKVVYLALLNHPEGIIIKSMIDYKDELWAYYQNVAGTKAKIENIESLCDPTNNSVNEKISRIKSAFTQAMEKNYKEDLPSFLPSGKRGEAITVSVDRGRIRNRAQITE